MKNLCKCHFHYLFSRSARMVLLAIFIISILSAITGIGMLHQEYGYTENNRLYFENYFFIQKILTIFLSAFVYTNAFLPKSDQYVYLILPRNVTRVRYFLTKCLTITFVLLFFVWFEIVIYAIVGFLGYSSFLMTWTSFVFFFRMFLLSLSYGILGLLLILFFKNMYTVLLPFLSMMLGTMINENKMSGISLVYNALFPNFRYDTPEFIFGTIHVLLYLGCLLATSLLLYLHADLG